MTSECRARLQQLLIRDEGMVLHAYQDSLGYQTIGVGRLIDGRKGGGISTEEALLLLDHDLDRVWADVVERFPGFVRLDSVRQAVLLSMAFNLGIDGLAGFKVTLASVWRGDYATAADQMLESRWAGQVGARAQRLATMMRIGLWPGEDRRA